MSEIGLYPALLKAFKQISFFLDLTEIILSKHESFCFIIDESCETNNPLTEADKISLFANPKNLTLNMYYQYPIFNEFNTTTIFFAPYNYENFINSHVNKKYYDKLMMENIGNCFAGKDKNPSEVLMLMGHSFGEKKNQLNLLTMMVINHLAEIFTNDKISSDQDLNSLIKISQFLKKCTGFISPMNNEKNIAKENYMKEKNLAGVLTEDDEKAIKSIYNGIDTKYHKEIDQELASIKTIKIDRDKILHHLRNSNINTENIINFFLKYFNNATLIIASDIADYIRSGVLTDRPKIFDIYKSLKLISSHEDDSRKIEKRFDDLIQIYRQSPIRGGSLNTINHNEYLIITTVVIFLFLMMLWIRGSCRMTLLNTLPMNDNNFFSNICLRGHYGRE